MRGRWFFGAAGGLSMLGLTMLALATSGRANESALTVFGMKWTVPNASDWAVIQEEGTAVLHMVTARGPVSGVPRRPTQFALLDAPASPEFSLELDIRPLKRSCILVYAYRDEAHFNYVHLSTDTATKQPVHNGVFHAYGGERVRISSPDGPAAFPEINRWYHVQLKFAGAEGEVETTVDGQSIPALHAVDLSLPSGRVGMGSFDETADFRNVQLRTDSARLRY